jgi:hypothetical protein
MKDRIGNRFVNGLKEPGRYKCAELKGFGVKVTPAGKKVYFVETSVKGGPARVTVTIGTHGVAKGERPSGAGTPEGDRGGKTPRS